eukprot:765222-Hanusia_phi.AAC.1
MISTKSQTAWQVQAVQAGQVWEVLTALQHEYPELYDEKSKELLSLYKEMYARAVTLKLRKIEESLDEFYSTFMVSEQQQLDQNASAIVSEKIRGQYFHDRMSGFSEYSACWRYIEEKRGFQDVKSLERSLKSREKSMLKDLHSAALTIVKEASKQKQDADERVAASIQ